MYELKVNKKLLQRAGIQSALIGGLLFFSIAFSIYPIYSHFDGEANDTAILKKRTKSIEKPGFVLFGVNRNIFCLSSSLIGMAIGFSMRKTIAQDWQRRQDLKNLIKQGENL